MNNDNRFFTVVIRLKVNKNNSSFKIFNGTYSNNIKMARIYIFSIENYICITDEYIVESFNDIFSNLYSEI